MGGRHVVDVVMQVLEVIAVPVPERVVKPSSTRPYSRRIDTTCSPSSRPRSETESSFASTALTSRAQSRQPS